MFSFFDDIRKQITFKEESTVTSAVFTSMKAAMVTTLLACLLVTAKTYIGDNINCVTGFSGNQHKAIETYCFISSTFSLVNLSDTSAPYPGLGPIPSEEEEELLRHAYYQWVPLMLAIQTALLHFPRSLWKDVIDRKKFQSVLFDLNRLHVPEPDAVQQNLEKSAGYAASTLGLHGLYAGRFFMCEIVAAVISLSNLFITNLFLGGGFFQFGNSALKYLFGDVTDISNPLNEVFPKITKCTWNKFGPTGSIQSFDSLCVLPLNIVNEKTYVMLWLVYIITSAVIGASLLWHISLIISSKLRNWYVMHRLRNTNTKEMYYTISRKLDYGDWFVIRHLSTKMAPRYFERWMQIFCAEIEK